MTCAGFIFIYILYSGPFRTRRVLQKCSCPIGTLTTLILGLAQSPQRCFPHVNYSIRRNVATCVPERWGYDFVVRSHLVFVGSCWFFDHQYVYKCILQHQQHPDDSRELRVSAGARRQLWRTALLHSARAISTGLFNEPVHDATQFLCAYDYR